MKLERLFMKFKVIIFPFILTLLQLTELFSFEGKIISTNPKIFVRAPFNGTIQEVDVQNGSFVDQDKILLKFDVTQEVNAQNKLQSDYLKILAIQARLFAHSREKSAVLYSRELTEELKNHPELKSILDSQKKEFYSFQNEQQEMQKSLEEKNRHLKNILIGIEDRLRRAEADLAKVTEAEQIALKRIEIPYGKYKVDYIRNIKEQVQTKVDSIRVEQRNVQDQIDSNIAQYNEYKMTFKNTVKQGLDQSQNKLNSIKEQLIQLQYKIDSGTLRSPIVGLVEFTDKLASGQSARADELLMTITPLNYFTLIEGYLADKSKPTLKKVKVNFLQPDIPEMEGEVSYTTPGSVDIDGKQMYILYIKVPNQNLENYSSLHPGLPVDIN